MAGNHPTPIETPRAVVLGEVLSALNSADQNGQKLRTTSVHEYRTAVLKALTPIAKQTEPEPLAGGDDAGGTVVDMWAGMQRHA